MAREASQVLIRQGPACAEADAEISASAGSAAVLPGDAAFIGLKSSVGNRSGGRAGLHKGGGDRKVVRSVDITVHLALGIRRIGDKDPVDCACVRQDGAQYVVGPPGDPTASRKPASPRALRCIATAGIEVEIARD